MSSGATSVWLGVTIASVVRWRRGWGASWCSLVGFSAVTRVSVRDLYAHADEGVFVGRYVGRAVPLHGIKMLKLRGSERLSAKARPC
eukprot:COSAG04_NODE_2240_length_4467_cov_2.485806_1_plen_87_part_00